MKLLTLQLRNDGLHGDEKLTGQCDGLLWILSHWVALREEGFEETVVALVEQVRPITVDVISVLLNKTVYAVYDL